MDLSEVQKALVPGAEEALKIPLSYEEFREACLLTYIDTAIKDCGGVQERAARKIGVTGALISQAVGGKVLARFRGKKKTPEQK